MRSKRHDSFWVMEKSPHHLFQSLLSWEICGRFSLLSSWTYFSWYLKYLTDWLFSCASQLVIAWNEMQWVHCQEIKKSNSTVLSLLCCRWKQHVFSTRIEKPDEREWQKSTTVVGCKTVAGRCERGMGCCCFFVFDVIKNHRNTCSYVLPVGYWLA